MATKQTKLHPVATSAATTPTHSDHIADLLGMADGSAGALLALTSGDHVADGPAALGDAFSHLGQDLLILARHADAVVSEDSPHDLLSFGIYRAAQRLEILARIVNRLTAVGAVKASQ